MENNKPHPLFLVAAVSLTLAGLAAAAHFTGILPSAKTQSAPVLAAAQVPAPPPATLPAAPVPAPTATPVPAPAATPAPAPEAKAPSTIAIPPGATVTITPEGKAAPKSPSRPVTRHVPAAPAGNAGIDVIPAARPQTIPASTAAAPPVCRECGTVENVREVQTHGEGSGLGAVAGGVVGGLLGNQVGRGKGKDAATVVGAIGGAVAGHQVEKQVRSDKRYEITVRFDDGAIRTYTQTSATGWRNGDRVRLDNGAIRSL